MSGVQRPPAGGVSVTVAPGPEFAEVARLLRGPAQQALRKSMNKRIRSAADPVLKDLRQAVRATPSRGARGGGATARGYHAGSGSAARRRGGGLRETIASAVQLKVQLNGQSVGVKIRVDGAKLPPDQRGLPKLLDGQRPWRHPVYGDRSTWVAQRSCPWWTPTIEANLTRLRGEVAAILEDVLTELSL